MRTTRPGSATRRSATPRRTRMPTARRRPMRSRMRTAPPTPRPAWRAAGSGVGSGMRRDGMPAIDRTKTRTKMPMTIRIHGRASRSSGVGKRATVAGLVAHRPRCLAAGRHASGRSPGVVGRRSSRESRPGRPPPDRRWIGRGIRLGDGSATVLDLPAGLTRAPGGADPEGPCQERQRSDDQQCEGRDRQVEDQSHGARRVADRPLNGRCAWTARRGRSAPATAQMRAADDEHHAPDR